MGLENGLENSVSHFNVYFDHVTRSLLLPQLKQLYSKMDILAPEKQKALMLDSQQGLSEGAMRIDFATYLPDNILVKVDRASMLNSLEVRAPFLDFEIIEFAYNKVPEHLKVDGFQRKILLKELARKLLPEALDLNRKQGFVLPLKSWFKEKESQIFKETLLASDCMFERSIIKKMLLGQNLGLKNAERLFSLTLFELWRKHYKIPAL
jgi:asparagine synthase (glutamine-hydrolysing)